MPRCPVCKVQLDLVRYEGVPIFDCGSCGGHWLQPMQLDCILAKRELELPEPVRQKLMDRADAADSRKPVWCMTCGKEMVKEQFKYWSEIQLDRCPKCDGLWLDPGELEKCQIYWEYMQDHPEEWGDNDAIERKALLEAQLAERRAQLRNMREEAAQNPSWRRTSPAASRFFLLDMLAQLFRR